MHTMFIKYVFLLPFLFLLALKHLYICSLLIVALVLALATPFNPSVGLSGFILWGALLIRPSFRGALVPEFVLPIVNEEVCKWNNVILWQKCIVLLTAIFFRVGSSLLQNCIDKCRWNKISINMKKEGFFKGIFVK